MREEDARYAEEATTGTKGLGKVIILKEMIDILATITKGTHLSEEAADLMREESFADKKETNFPISTNQEKTSLSLDTEEDHYPESGMELLIKVSCKIKNLFMY